MTLLITGIVIFFGVHYYSAFRSRVPGKDIKEKMGEGAYMGLYSLVSIIGLGLMIYGYMGAAPSGMMYVGPEWGRNVSIALMLPAYILLVAAYVPGTHIKKRIHHPMLSAIILWGIAHLLIGVDHKEALLFGSFLVYSIVDFVAASSRGDDYSSMQVSVTNDLIAIVIGGAVFAGVLLWGHQTAFGIAPLI